MTSNSKVGARIGRRLGEALGRLLGGRAGRALGIWIAEGGSRSSTDAEEASGDAAASASTEEESTGEESTDEASASSGDDETADEGSDRPESRAALDDRSYRELQTLAKELDVTANLSREEMTDRLVEELGIHEED